MRLGGPIFEPAADPAAWVAAHRTLGYRAAYAPFDRAPEPAALNAWLAAAREADLVIAEVGAWSNPLSADADERRKAVALCQERLALAETIGARCCVNIAGSRNRAKWDGPDPSHFTRDVFDDVVQTTRAIIDAVKPRRTFFTLETMPWVPPSSIEEYEELIRAVDRPAFAVHFDPCNLVVSPRLYYRSGDLIRDFLKRLGSRTKSVHVKDLALAPEMTVHLSEVRLGLGGIDLQALLVAVRDLNPDLPLMLEHLPTAEDYRAAADHLRSVEATL